MLTKYEVTRYGAIMRRVYTRETEHRYYRAGYRSGTEQWISKKSRHTGEHFDTFEAAKARAIEIVTAEYDRAASAVVRWGDRLRAVKAQTEAQE